MILSSLDEASLQREEVDYKWWFEQPPPYYAPNQIVDATDPLLLVHDPPIAQTRGRPTHVQWNLRREKEKERSTRRDPSQFELVDKALEKKRLEKENLQFSVSQKSCPKFQNPNTYTSAPKTSLRLEKKVDEDARAIRRLQIEKKEGLLLEKRIKEVEAELRNSGACRKDILEIHKEGVQHFFRKA